MSASGGRPKRRSVFDTVADIYDRARPAYPDALIDALVALAGLRDGARILEVGCGTGQLTRPLAQRGYRVQAVELGPSLAAAAARNLAAFPGVRVHNAAFEDWALPVEPFDLVVSATAFHWIDPAVRFAKAADALTASGALAIIETHHVSGRDDAFFDQVQDCYERHMPGTPPGIRLSPGHAIEPELGGSGAERFGTPLTRRFEVEIRYTTAEYLEVLKTYSGHIELSASNAAALYACVAHLLDTSFGGTVRKQYLFLLTVASLRPRISGHAV